MISICLLFGIFPAALKKQIENQSKGAIQYAADTLQKSIIAGIVSYYDDIHIVNLPFLSSYPKYYNKILSPSADIKECEDMVSGVSLSYLNLPLLKFISKERQAYKELKNWGASVTGEKIVIIYSAHSPLLKAAVRYKNNIDNKTKILLIVPDLPEYMAHSRNFIVDQLKKVDMKSLSLLYNDVDGFILLTEYMKDKLLINGKPYKVIEGIFNPQDQLISELSSRKSIFYSGTLAKRYGVMTLVNAFIKADLKDYVLEICGMGDSKDEITRLASRCPNIHYYGQLPREKVLQMQRSATLLINPRTPEGEFTKYSFPSKVMEYLASGVPTLMYKLQGIPDEYYDYCYYITELGEDALANKLKMIVNKPHVELKQLGGKAQKFILEKKNPVSQCLKICTLIDEVLDNHGKEVN